MIDPIESKFYMEDDRLMLQWRGARATRRTPCGGTVDLTAHLEGIVRAILSEQQLCIHAPKPVEGPKPR